MPDKPPTLRFFARMLVLGFAILLASRNLQAEDFEFFEMHIRPLLVENCYSCHSATSKKIKGGLLLDTRDGLLKGGDTGPAVVPGDPEKSLLIKAVRYLDKDLQMPPKDKRLSESQIADLVMWVKMGAPDPRSGPAAATAVAPSTQPPYDFAAARKLWAFQTPRKPTIPAVTNRRWTQSPIDNFILAQLEEKHLSPALMADKRTLIRRATFDLIGLPPTPQEIDAFLEDRSTNAFAKVVDRLLASPHYGERWGRHWLDVVRYTDSLDARGIGSEGDVAEAYRYRDWVVNAFNQDLPYDQFIIEQIAGDLLPPKEPAGINRDGIIATGMYAIGNWGNGDADKEKVITDIADDQVDVTSRAFLGLTVACARCHDHKFDPIPTADYYSLAGIFFSSHILPKMASKGEGERLLRIPLISEAELAARKQREDRIAELEKQIEKLTDERIAGLAQDLLPRTAQYLMAAADYKNRPTDNSSSGVATFLAARNQEFHADAETLGQWIDYLGFGEAKPLSRTIRDVSGKTGLYGLRNANNADTPSAVMNTTDQEVSFSTIKLPPRSVAMHPSPKAGVAAAWKSPFTGTVQIKGRVSDADPNCGDGIEWAIVVRSEHGTKQLASGAFPNGGAQSFREGKGADNLNSVEVKNGETIQLIVSPKAEYSCDTTVVELELAEHGGQTRVWNLTRDVLKGVAEGNYFYSDSFRNEAVWRFYDLDNQPTPGQSAPGSLLAKWIDAVNQKAPKADLETLAIEIQSALQIVDATNSPVGQLRGDLLNPKSSFWVAARNDEGILTVTSRQQIAKSRDELASLKSNPPPPIPTANGLQEGGIPESAQAGIHDVKIHIRGRYDRLAETVPRRFPRLLAGDDQPPITQGSGRLQLAHWIASPENPLTARVMVNRIWQHHFGEGIVRTPNNYGKLGTPPTHPELLDYLACQFVESGWSVKAMHRAIMLSAAYQQSSTPDPAVLKADPDNLLFGRMNRRRLESEALRDSLLTVAGDLDPTLGGPSIRDLSIHRRTLYVMTVRSDRATYQFLFDAADPNVIVEKRLDSTVAPQALFLLNHPFAMDQVKALARRVEKECASDDRARIQWLYRQLYGREADPREIKIGLRALARARASAAKAEETNASEAAWEQYCQILVCANEFVYVD